MNTPRFARLRDHYAREEQAARRLLGERERERATAAEALRRAEDEIRSVTAGSVAWRMRDQFELWRNAAVPRINRLGAVHAAAERACETARQTLIEAHRRTATFDKLREIDLAAIRRADERRQGRALDELGIRRFTSASGNTP